MQNSKKTIFHREDAVLPLSKIYRSVTKEWSFDVMGKLSKYRGFLYFLALFVITSCRPTKYNVYFRNLQRDTTLRNIVAPDFELKIQKNDLLGISVASLSPDVAFYNTQPGSSGAAPGASATNGYLVDGLGNISFVKLGNIHVEGMTRKELKDTLEKSLIPYLKDAFVTVSFQNRHITILGAATSEVLPLAGNNMTILDALASSGDIGQKGRMDNVLVIRDTGNAKIFKRLNLENNSIFSSAYYYMQPNDIVYVEPTTVRTPITTPQILSYVATGVSLIFLILNALKL